jgi:hypothetical protein
MQYGTFLLQGLVVVVVSGCLPATGGHIGQYQAIGHHQAREQVGEHCTFTNKVLKYIEFPRLVQAMLKDTQPKTLVRVAW